jgi:hypothetical protein
MRDVSDRLLSNHGEGVLLDRSAVTTSTKDEFERSACQPTGTADDRIEFRSHGVHVTNISKAAPRLAKNLTDAHAAGRAVLSHATALEGIVNYDLTPGRFLPEIRRRGRSRDHRGFEACTGFRPSGDSITVPIGIDIV